MTLHTELNKSILIICNDVIGKKMAGPAIRSVHIAHSLSQRFKVTLVAPHVYDGISYAFTLLEASDKVLKELANASDFILIQGDALVRYPFLKQAKAALIADLYCPIPLEYHQVSNSVALDVRLDMGSHLANVVAEQLAYADLFLCASERQKDFWFGALTVAGRVNGLRWERANQANLDDLIITLPFGMSDQDPVLEQRQRGALRTMFQIPDDHFVAIWGGGVYEWFDPLSIIRAIHQLSQQNLPIHLVFMGVKHPNPGIAEHDMCALALELSRELGVLDRFVHFNFGWVEYDTRHEYFLDANVGVSAHFDTPETRFSFRTRMLDYLWCDLPILATKGDFFGDAVDRNGLGIAVDYGDVEGWANALSQMYSDHAAFQQCVAHIRSFKESYRWSSVTHAFAERLYGLAPAADREYIRKVFTRATVKPSLAMRLKNVYANGGLGLVLKLGIRRLYLSIFRV